MRNSLSSLLRMVQKTKKTSSERQFCGRKHLVDERIENRIGPDW